MPHMDHLAIPYAERFWYEFRSLHWKGFVAYQAINLHKVSSLLCQTAGSDQCSIVQICLFVFIWFIHSILCYMTVKTNILYNSHPGAVLVFSAAVLGMSSNSPKNAWRGDWGCLHVYTCMWPKRLLLKLHIWCVDTMLFEFYQPSTICELPSFKEKAYVWLFLQLLHLLSDHFNVFGDVSGLLPNGQDIWHKERRHLGERD